MTTTVESVTSADGTTITLERSGEGPPVVLIGGAFNDRTTVASLAGALAPRSPPSPTTVAGGATAATPTPRTAHRWTARSRTSPR